MQQHLGEHLFAGCLYNLHQIHTARMRIEGDNVSIDTDKTVDIDSVLEAEYEANKAIWKNIPVEIIYPDWEEIKANARKLPPQNAENIRIVKVKGVDYVPCCGLHVNTTGQVGLIKITSIENHKGGSRIYLKCGNAAYRWLNSLYHEVRKAEAELVCGYDGINEKILVLKNQIHELKSLNESITEKFLKPIAENLINNSESINEYKLVKYIMRDSNQDDVKKMFRILTENHNVIAVIACENSDGVFITIGTHKENKNIDIRNAFKTAINILDGKGGGSKFCAQGWGKNHKLDEAIESAVNEIKNNINQC